MLEKDIENLIAEHPDEIFPGEGFKLLGQQVGIEGRRIDLLFEDRLGRRIIVEVKRGVLSREASGQVAEYYGLLKSKDPSQAYELVLCANIIPKERRSFLETIGIDCRELGLARIAEIGTRYGYRFPDDAPTPPVYPPVASQQQDGVPPDSGDGEVSVWLFQANPERYDILNALADPEVGNGMHWLVNQHRGRIRKGHLGLIWMSGSGAGIYAVTRIESDPAEMQEFPAERKYWLSSSESVTATRVLMTVIRRLTNRPLLRADLIRAPGLQELSIFRQSQGSNFPVRDREWRVIAQFI